jgi:hypothetical protein
LEVADRANWQVSPNAYGEPLSHVTQITFKPSNINPKTCPLAWYAALDLEVGDPVRVMARPPGGVVQQADCVVDRIIHTVYQTAGEWVVTLELSPLVPAWVLAAWRTTLNAATIAGAITVVLNPSPDSATNPVEAVLHPGQILTIYDAGAADTFGVLSVTSSSPGNAGYASVSCALAAVSSTSTLSAAVGMFYTGAGTVTLTSNSPAGTAAIIVEGELMTVTAGAGTATLTVTRTGPTSQAPHAAGAVVAFLASTGLVRAHPAGSGVFEALSATPDGKTVWNPNRWDARSVLGALTSTVKTSVGIGVGSVVLTALSDWPSNTPGGSIVKGDLLRLSPNTANSETLTVDSVGAAGADGSFTVTFTGNTAHAHNAGDVVCEPLPSGVNDPTLVVPSTVMGY